MSRRTEKVASLIQHEVGEFIIKLELPALTTISKVEITPDLKWGKLWVTVMGDDKEQKEVLSILGENLPELQRSLNQKLEMKFVPRIKFVLDHGEEYAAKINELLRKAHESR
ncbi:MAG: ribosome-binding factor A [Candidatus Doudnabacteria bacterium RIFCSPLOWO2_02_FULL_42_9]|uniref:Ribosome-binding factor A n=1 Tax=Candidatus Doudnabacteria bacterium RIFCSPHIGHO2_01_FULL_41_86 TaxID=1817821 RepID=A0A1F5N8R6_9BACT|nr:MAG: ribosome-binding factor A [Candidatus Doudnabacteria bacterium RIFCSPHIGHO2_01_FULL_41_86]OGE75161.1 MAG: ribosome-binding factor A [Candidatus Doudnabacteria bacterium RIFCSPHIGHO2_01_43_10]OGE86414.1 MAG: ribosome-binding factor A [Candidatus Doudnabacteria bacterium RIFCSPHIGHO2_12_FULL_42_22]OGE87413.1 MAG: ribosome-binding factor A [Candidatus Doudnabacteria bacterium RIFCSPHIGHO2_02_FULL_42_25]OGE92711.1 MAG: ribosome-binding factor A [Candidatus Doudnabacteria bacterium RIFCSPLOW